MYLAESLRLCVMVLFCLQWSVFGFRVPRRVSNRVGDVCLRMPALFAAKKKKKKILKASGATSGDSTAPRRVSSDMNVSVRKQIQFAKAYKRLVSNSRQNARQHSPRVRKERAPKPEKEEYVEIDYENTAPPLLFVDGYNIIGYINSVEGRRVTLDEARDCLVADLCVVASATGWAIECVFDAYNNPLNAAGARVQQDGISVYYTSRKETADDYIERRINDLQGRNPNLVVATDDNALRSTAIGLGAGFLTASMILEEFRVAYRGWQIVEEEMEEEARRLRPTVGGNTSPDMRAAIREMMSLNAGIDATALEEEDAKRRDMQSSQSLGASKPKRKDVDLTMENLREVIGAMSKEERDAPAPAVTSTLATQEEPASSKGKKSKRKPKAKAIDVNASNLQDIIDQMKQERGK